MAAIATHEENLEATMDERLELLRLVLTENWELGHRPVADIELS